jgi:hypothetical protein
MKLQQKTQCHNTSRHVNPEEKTKCNHMSVVLFHCVSDIYQVLHLWWSWLIHPLSTSLQQIACRIRYWLSYPCVKIKLDILDCLNQPIRSQLEMEGLRPTEHVGRDISTPNVDLLRIVSQWNFRDSICWTSSQTR